ncbi:MAG: hypothetical protein AAGH76_14995 [Pseudomonadota bacterium]
MSVRRLNRVVTGLMQSWLVLVFSFSTAALAEESQIELFQGCWQTDPPAAVRANTITLCVEGTTVAASVFYPNDDHNSTFCTSSGVTAVIEDRVVSIETELGVCENGRSLGEIDLKCSLIGSKELNCIDRGYRQFRFWRVDSSPKPPTGDE